MPIGVVLHISAKLRPNRDMEVAHGTAPHQRFSLPRGAALVSYNSGIYRDDNAVGQSHMCTTNYCDAGERRLKRAIPLPALRRSSQRRNSPHGFICQHHTSTSPEWGDQPLRSGPSGPLERRGDCIWSSRRLPAFEGANLGRRHIAPIFSARGH